MSDSFFARFIRRKGKGKGKAGRNDASNTSPEPRQKTFGLNPLISTAAETQQDQVVTGAAASENFPVDIIALHGITGDAFDTWTAPNGVLWLRDFLLHDLPGARVFSYGYDASVFFTKATGDIDSYARTLLEGIKQKRLGQNRTRSIIFICYSMGGLVLKRAINIATLTDSIYRNVREYCYGIIFLSTPHRGSTGTSFPKLLTGVVNLATPILSRFIGRNRKELIELLDKDAPGLEQMSLDFSDNLFNIGIASFVEEMITTPARDRIVDDHTSFIGSPGERRVYLGGCDHGTVCRFEERDNNYNLILGILREWCNAAVGHDKTRVDEIQDCLKRLKTSHQAEPEAHLISVAKPQNGTFEWIKNRPGFRDLSQAQSSRLIHVTGMPGCGKSVLAASLFKELKQLEKFKAKGFYACNGGDASRRAAQNVLSSLVAQLFIAGVEKLSDHQLTEMFEAVPLPVGFDTFDPLAEIVARACQCSHFKSLIVIDALDECDPGRDREKLVRLFTEIIQAKGNVAITAIVLSRPYWDISFEELDARSYFHIDLDGEGDMQKDLRAFVEKNVDKFVSKRKGYGPFRDDIFTRIFNRARGPQSGMFLMVELLIDLLDRSTDSSLRGMRDTIDSLPNTLEIIYQRIWEGIDESDQEYARHMMTWILTMFGSVKVDTLADALAHEAFLASEGDISDDAMEEARPRDLASDLKRVLGPLIRISGDYEHQYVRVTHQTVKEYFMPSNGKPLDVVEAKRPSLEKDFHIHIASICVLGLVLYEREFTGDWRNGDAPPVSLTLPLSGWTYIWKRELTPFRAYAKYECIKHRWAARDAGESQKEIDEFDILFRRTVRQAEYWLDDTAEKPFWWSTEEGWLDDD
ncbi:hypothetical protein GP486_007490 [Trichoglossum hirsutum]|uniref:AAA+ ATPase domain-containing protein n=1 Tax=Trichoglossum hirsutum TaxID=265104 RepID=A0A9P8I699_9PEZI|nr:hypothetical protein GP486_007490 [Trichoglossum hirsutum]